MHDNHNPVYKIQKVWIVKQLYFVKLVLLYYLEDMCAINWKITHVLHRQRGNLVSKQSEIWSPGVPPNVICTLHFLVSFRSKLQMPRLPASSVNVAMILSLWYGHVLVFHGINRNNPWRLGVHKFYKKHVFLNQSTRWRSFMPSDAHIRQ